MRLRLLPILFLLVVACRRPGDGDRGAELGECEKLDGRAAIDECYGKHAVDTSSPVLCEHIAARPAKNECYTHLARQVPDEALCAKVDEVSARATCLVGVGRRKKDPAICETVEDPDRRAGCLADVARAKKSAVVCDAITIVEQRLECLSALAVDQPSVCKRIVESDARDRCLARALTAVAAPKGNEALCDEIATATLEDRCWSAVAIRQDVLLCEKVSAVDARLECYRAASKAIGDEASCAKILVSAGADACFHALAQERRNAKLCEQIEDRVAKQACSEEVGRATGAAPTVDERIRKGITRVSATEYRVTREAFRLILADEGQLLREMRTVPQLQDGKIVGFRLSGIRPDSVGGLLGIENGDRLERLNGHDMSAPDEALKAHESVKRAEKISAAIHRGGEVLTLVYTVK